MAIPTITLEKIPKIIDPIPAVAVPPPAAPAAAPAAALPAALPADCSAAPQAVVETFVFIDPVEAAASKASFSMGIESNASVSNPISDIDAIVSEIINITF